MEKKHYITPGIQVMDYVPNVVIAMSWNDEETDEALTNERRSSGHDNDGWDSFWNERE